LEQLISLIPDTCKQLILIPHRFLHLLPLHALPLNDGTCLLDHYQNGVSYAPSCQLLQLVQNQKRPYFQNLFAIQNPTGDLTYTDLEVETIRLFFPEEDIKILAGQAATKTALNTYQNLPSIHCGHFSCHGYFNMASPLKSALLLADCYIPTPETLDPNYHLPLKDGRAVDLTKCLTLGEIFRFNLNQCRLVVLSACETGLIDFTNTSDEYIGLPSGFLIAGSSSVVSSLWTVSDLSTSFLMIKFIQILKSATDISVPLALNQAQQWLRDATKEKLQEWVKKLPLDSTKKGKIRRLIRVC
jgi:CHAT domain-containing protein